MISIQRDIYQHYGGHGFHFLPGTLKVSPTGKQPSLQNNNLLLVLYEQKLVFSVFETKKEMNE